MTRVILGLGSNVGERKFFLRAAILLLQERQVIAQLQESTINEVAALLPAGAPQDWDLPYLNMAVAGDTTLSPVKLLEAIKQIELDLGRPPSERWAPRVIDIDILAFGSLSYRADQLTIPHPSLCSREWALGPLVELWPSWRHPHSGMLGSEYLAALQIKKAA